MNRALPARPRVVDGCLLAVALALLVVGALSGTFIRHAVQISPLLAASLFARRRPDQAAAAALPLFLFWLAIAVLIWLYLAGVADWASGSYPPVEIALSVALGVAALAGGLTAARDLAGRPAARALLIFISFAALQALAFWLSFRPALAHD